jgi:Berberine and berberine like
LLPSVPTNFDHSSWTTSYPASAENDALAVKYGHQARELWVQGQTPHRLNAYPNYAYGDETLAQLFGYDTWRLERLKALKKKWDPSGKFNFYNPIR